MTVKELINQLQQYSSDYTVVVDRYSDYGEVQQARVISVSPEPRNVPWNRRLLHLTDKGQPVVYLTWDTPK
jgi:hypothetical protein